MGGAAVATLIGRAGAARAISQDLFVSCAADQNGGYLVSGFGRDGTTRFAIPLPARGHVITFRPSRMECVVFARRPGSFAAVLDCTGARLSAMIENATRRRFQGHGTYSADGRYLFATENDYEAGRGVLGIYDADDGYRRIGEVPSHGVGPHDLRLLPDGGKLAVANGGIRTHPDLGRAKLNIETMAPNLAIVDLRTGALVERASLPRRLHQLSIRHLDVSRTGQVAVAMQYEGDRRDRVPLVGCYRGAGKIDLFRAPDQIQRRMRHYTGSIAYDETERFIAVSSPKGHLVTIWDARSGAYLHVIEARDSAGIAATGLEGEFLVSGGDGKLRLIDARTGKIANLPTPDGRFRWDNHIGALPG